MECYQFLKEPLIQKCIGGSGLALALALFVIGLIVVGTHNDPHAIVIAISMILAILSSILMCIACYRDRSTSLIDV